MKKRLSTRAMLEKAAPYLYRHKENGGYYGIKKVAGRIKIAALRAGGDHATTDRKIAERLLRDWIGNLEDADATSGDMTLETLLAKFVAVRGGLADKTKATEASIIKRFRGKEFPRPMSTPVARVTTADLKEFLANIAGEIRHATYNRYRLFLMELFAVAIDARAIPKNSNPFDPEAIPAKKKQEVVRHIPTEEEFVKLVNEIRKPSWKVVKGKRGGQRPMSFNESANFVEFEGRAGIGQAEVARVEWENVGDTEIRVIRKKTGREFFVPIYTDLRPLLARMRAEAGPNPTGRLFKMSDPKKAIDAALKRLGIRHYSQRNFRSFRVVRSLENGASAKFVAGTQGHSDNGKLVTEIYSNILRSREEEANYRAAQLALADGKVVAFKAPKKAKVVKAEKAAAAA